MHHRELLLLLVIELGAIGVILKQVWVLLKKQLLVSQLLGLLDIGWLQHEVAVIGPRTFISQICLIPIVKAIVVRILGTSLVHHLLSWLSTYGGCLQFACGCIFRSSFSDFSNDT